MSIYDFIPYFIRQLRSKLRIKKLYGIHGRFLTDMIADDVVLGNDIYLASRVEVRGG